MDDDNIVRYGHSTRVEEDTIRQYKWTDEKLDSDAFLYQNVINFKRSANPRGHAHHCVMCGDKRAAIPSQNKDVCKTCDSAYWLVEAIQILVKFCKGRCDHKMCPIFAWSSSAFPRFLIRPRSHAFHLSYPCALTFYIIV